MINDYVENMNKNCLFWISLKKYYCVFKKKKKKNTQFQRHIRIVRDKFGTSLVSPRGEPDLSVFFGKIKDAHRFYLTWFGRILNNFVENFPSLARLAYFIHDARRQSRG